MKRILFLTILMYIFCFSFKVSAKDIVINGIVYDDSVNIKESGFVYDADSKNLYLDGYNGDLIAYSGVLNIVISNTNIIDTKAILVAIDVNELIIKGSGKLIILRGSVGIETDSLRVEDVDVLIRNCNIGILVYNSKTTFLKTNVVIENSVLGIYSSDRMNVQESNVNIINCNLGIRRSEGAIWNLDNTNLYVDTTSYSLDLVEINNIINSNIVLKSDRLATTVKGINLSSNNILYVCNDGVNYIKEVEYQHYPIIKITQADKMDDLLENDSKLLIDVEKVFFSDDKKEDNESNIDDDTITSSEYTESEYTYSEYDKVEILNPNTFDQIYLHLIFFGLSLILIISIGCLWRHHE